MFGGLANLGNLLKQAQQMGGRLEEINTTLKSKRVHGSSGGGMIEVEANGFGEVLRLSIDPTLIERQERDMLEDLIPAAVNEAVRKARELHAEEMKSLANGFGFPGLDEALSKLTNSDRS